MNIVVEMIQSHTEKTIKLEKASVRTLYLNTLSPVAIPDCAAAICQHSQLAITESLYSERGAYAQEGPGHENLGQIRPSK